MNEAKIVYKYFQSLKRYIRREIASMVSEWVIEFMESDEMKKASLEIFYLTLIDLYHLKIISEAEDSGSDKSKQEVRSAFNFI